MQHQASSAHEDARHAMVASQLRTSGVSDPRVVATMSSVRREDFVGGENGEAAYRDTPLVLANGRFQNAPLTTARLIVEAHIAVGDHVLLIGATGGYTAAVLARLAGSVTAVESDATLVADARRNLADEDGVSIVEGALHAGAADAAPFDVLIVDGAIESLPASLAAQVRPGGRIVAGIADRGVTRLATAIRGAGEVVLEPFADIDCVVLPGFARPHAFHFAG